MWNLVPKPRSAIKTIQWFPFFAKLEGKKWTTKLENGKHPVRIEYLKSAHPYERYSESDPEVNARMEFARYQTLGLSYLDDSDLIRITEAGYALVSRENQSEILLRQLLKWQFPSNIHKGRRYEDLHIFPFEIILHLLNEFQSINKFEIAVSIFSCKSIDDIEKAKSNIYGYRDLLGSTDNDAKQIFFDNFLIWNPNLPNKPETYLDYSDVIQRYLEFTGIFSTSGRGPLTRIHVPERSKVKFIQLLNDYNFVFIDEYDDPVAFYQKFGGLEFTQLPWDNRANLAKIIQNKLEKINNENASIKVEDSLENLSFQELQELDEKSSRILLEVNEKQFINVLSKTKVGRDEILEKFNDIIYGDEDDAALWFEVNTWKSLVAINGSHFVKRNFKMEYDLTPRSFAPGSGNTPDIEFYNKHCIIITEVSIQSGVSQWISEGSSVVDHVNKFIQLRYGEKFSGYQDIEDFITQENVRKIFGLFLCININERLLWQFYILCKESWLGEPVPIIPLELNEYLKIIDFIYKNEVPSNDFEAFLEEIIDEANNTKNYHEWRNRTKELINSLTDIKEK